MAENGRGRVRELSVRRVRSLRDENRRLKAENAKLAVKNSEIGQLRIDLGDYVRKAAERNRRILLIVREKTRLRSKLGEVTGRYNEDTKIHGHTRTQLKELEEKSEKAHRIASNATFGTRAVALRRIKALLEPPKKQ